jgi:ribokinase
MGGIIVAGSINMDVVSQVRAHPRPGETIFGSSLHYIPGGKGSNQAIAAARLGENVAFVGKLGRDPFGQSLHEFLQHERLSLDHLAFAESAPTGIALIVVDEKSENTIIVVSGANGEVSAADVESVPLTADDVVVSVFEIPQPTILRLFARTRAAGARTILNPAPALAFIDGLLPLVDVLVLNETELAFFAGGDVVADDLTALRTQAESLRAFDAQTILITLGSRGALAITGSDSLHVPGRAVKAVDTTGAGDCFVGALAVALSENRPLQEALDFANRAASISVQRLGAATSMPQRAEVDQIT